MSKSLSIILPAKNEAGALDTLLPQLRSLYTNAEIIVVNDGSTDDTISICEKNQVTCVTHAYCLGNGASIKHGARFAKGEILVFMDADGQHNPVFIKEMLERLDQGFDMVVGARSNNSQASIGRSLANRIYNWLASYMTGHKIQDLTSGFRVVRSARFHEFLYLLPNGFSYPTTSTMAFFRAGYLVGYLPVKVAKREGKSHIHIFRDGVRFLLIIFKIGTLYSPLKLFIPVSLLHALLGISYYGYTYSTESRLSLATVFLLTASVTIFLIGLVSEQITQLMYKPSTQDKLL